VRLNQREIVTFRATQLGDTPAQRADVALRAIAQAAASERPARVTRSTVGEAIRFEIDGETAFFLVADDLSVPRPQAQLEAAAADVQRKLQSALQEAREADDPKHLATAAALSAAATVVAFLLVQGLFFVRRQIGARLRQWHAAGQTRSAAAAYSEYAGMVLRFAGTAVTWGLVLLVVDAWLSFVLHRFAYTRPWGERSTEWLLGVLEQFALAVLGALPDLAIAVLIFVFARWVTQANTAFLQRIKRGDAHLAWLDADTVEPTRRVANGVIWLFALAMAYPYLPGSHSEAFKGVSVLAGVMLSLGASSVVGQVLSGFSLMYARLLRVGEYVKIGSTEGTVTALGMFATKIHTGMGEEVSLPNSVVFSQPIQNFSRLVQDGQFVVHTGVTIGYATPWRQVHAMLLEAAQRTAGVAPEPKPYVVQTALSDFYVEYRLCAQCDRTAPSRRAEVLNQLHGHIQDVFNENGVQIMSPHYMADPPQPQVVPPGSWPAIKPKAERPDRAA